MIRLSIYIILLAKFASGAFKEDPFMSLYSDSSYVTELNSTTFDNFTYCNNRANCPAVLVVFYNAVSESVFPYAPLVKELSEAINWWGILKVGAVNCALEVNTKLCHQQEFFTKTIGPIWQFVRITLFKYYSVKSRIGDLGSAIHPSSTTDYLIRNVVKQMIIDVEEHHIPNWPNITPLPTTIMYSRFWEHQPQTTQYILLIAVKNGIDFETMNFLVNCKRNQPDLEVRVALHGSQLAALMISDTYPSYTLLRRNEQLLTGSNWKGAQSKFANIAEEFNSTFNNLDLVFYERYKKDKAWIERQAGDIFYDPVRLSIYVPTDEAGHPISEIRDNRYDGIRLRYVPSNNKLPVLKHSLPLVSANSAFGICPEMIYLFLCLLILFV